MHVLTTCMYECVLSFRFVSLALPSDLFFLLVLLLIECLTCRACGNSTVELSTVIYGSSCANGILFPVSFLMTGCNLCALLILPQDFASSVLQFRVFFIQYKLN